MSNATKPALLAPGTSLGPYRVVKHVDSGGMGDVYRAVDTRLERTVALKVLPPHFSDDVERRQRFEREARLIAGLSHPHICALYDVGQQDTTSYLVMEFLQGETLGDRLGRGPLPLDVALRHAIEIGDALARAHRDDVVHRDLKPSNIVLTKSGAKLLDFGLAKLVERASTSVTSEDSPTESGGVLTSEVGSLLGTLQYMSPEQLEGKPVDARTDIFAFGLVLYQMLTGRRAFAGDSKAGVIAATLTANPPLVSTLQPLASPALDRLVKRCLEKDPNERWQTAHDLVSELRWIATGGRVPEPAAAGRWRPVALAVAAVLATALGFVLGLRWSGRGTPPQRLRASLLLPSGSTPVWPPHPMPLVISPDGRHTAFVVSLEGRSQLWVRSLDTLEAQALAGTEGAMYPFWSPDGQAIGFFAMGKLKRVSAGGGAVATLCDVSLPRGGTWNQTGDVLFGSAALGSIHRVSAAGGESTAVTSVQTGLGQSHHFWPQFLPDGKHFLFVGGSAQVPLESDANAVYVGALGSRDVKRLFYARERGFRSWDRRVAFAASQLLLLPQTTLLAQPFDVRGLAVRGEAVPIAENVQAFSASDTAIVFQEGPPDERFQLQWMDRAGRSVEALGEPAALGIGRLSPDGQTVAMERTEERSGNVDIWLYRFAREAWTRFTTAPGRDRSPVFSPDSRFVAFDSDHSGHFAVYRKAIAGGEEELLFDSAPGTSDFPGDWSPDGRVLALSHLELQPRENWDVWILPLAPPRQPLRFATGEAKQYEPRFSPNGHFLAYMSNETGRQEVYVCAYPDHRTHVQASTTGASWLMWRRDGRELLYRDLRGRFFLVDVKAEGEAVEVGSARPALEGAPPFARGHDFSVDGTRVLVSTSAEKTAGPATLLLNWAAPAR